MQKWIGLQFSLNTQALFSQIQCVEASQRKSFQLFLYHVGSRTAQSSSPSLIIPLPLSGWLFCQNLWKIEVHFHYRCVFHVFPFPRFWEHTNMITNLTIWKGNYCFLLRKLNITWKLYTNVLIVYLNSLLHSKRTPIYPYPVVFTVSVWQTNPAGTPGDSTDILLWHRSSKENVSILDSATKLWSPSWKWTHVNGTLYLFYGAVYNHQVSATVSAGVPSVIPWISCSGEIITGRTKHQPTTRTLPHWKTSHFSHKNKTKHTFKSFFW